MKSLTLRASRSATPFKSINTSSVSNSDVTNNPESKVPMIRKSSSLIVQEKNNWLVNNDREKSVAQKKIAEFLRAESIEESKEYLLLEKMVIEFIANNVSIRSEKNSPLILLSASQSQAEKNSTAKEDFKLEERYNKQKISEENEYLSLEKLKAKFHNFLYGTPLIFGSEIEKNRHELKENFLRFVHQQNYAEEHRDVNPSQRLFNGSNDGFKVTRQDKSPYVKTPEIIIPNDSKEELLGASGLKVYENIFSCFSKSTLNKEGQVIPVSATNLAVYDEKFPAELANKVFAHEASLNKAFVKRGFEKDASQEIGGAIKNDIFNELSLKEEKASPFTSASFDTPRKNLFSKWGAADEFIEIDLSKVQYLSPTYIVSLILFATDCPEANQKTSYKWRDSKKELWDDQSLQATEKLLVAHGIDPNGEWTEREKIAFYALVADEYLILGVTQPNIAKIVKAQSES